MHPAVVILLLACSIGTIIAPRPPALRWAGPPVLAGLAVGSGVIGPRIAAHAVEPLLAPLAFVVFAVPFALLLDDLGFFGEVALLVGSRRHYLGACWVLAGLVTALLNLDAAVVLLTPLYVRIAQRRHASRLALAFQPVLLSCLASSGLPISNLTNLIAASSLHLGPVAFLEHLALPSVAATTIGWWSYRRLLPRLDQLEAIGETEAVRGGDMASRRPRTGVLLGGGIVVTIVVAGFLLAPSVGGAPWEVAAAGDAVLVLATRRVPTAALPWRIVATVLGLGVLASGAASQLHVASLLGGSSPAGIVRDVAIGAGGANLVNNLPALLVSLPGLSAHSRWATWAFLLGTNVGPLLLPSASLAALLWLETLRRMNVRARERDYLQIAWRVGLPSLCAATGVLLAVRLALGPQ